MKVFGQRAGIEKKVGHGLESVIALGDEGFGHSSGDLGQGPANGFETVRPRQWKIEKVGRGVIEQVGQWITRLFAHCQAYTLSFA